MNVTSAPDQHRRCPGPANMPARSTHLPRANRPVGHLRTQCTNNPTIPTSASIAANPPSDCPTSNFHSRIGLVGHLRIHRTEAGEPVPGAPTYNHNARFHCPHCSRIFTHRMGLLGHIDLHDNLR
ncbi:unnamed protein product [Schistocephalus solidus]|uniref:C2H2-type domain-containing protein n=1 Tax=Schistocephalus solidus TaxID=70667 RepID=A0A183T602_SCHSO|nr:unnamed protein product [Schistocephalus solidus]